MLCCDTARETFASLGLFTFARTNKQLSVSGIQYSIQYRNYSSLHIRIRESHVNQHNRS